MAHNFTEAISYTKVKNATNMRILNTSLIHSTYRVWVPAWSWAQVGTAAQMVASDLSVPQHWLFSATGDTLTYYLARPQEWRNGSIGLILHWITSTGLVDQQWTISVCPMAELGVPPAVTDNEFVITSAPTAGCLTVSPVYGAEMASNCKIRSGTGGLHIAVKPHHVTTDLQFLGAEIVYIERGTAAGTSN